MILIDDEAEARAEIEALREAHRERLQRDRLRPVVIQDRTGYERLGQLALTVVGLLACAIIIALLLLSGGRDLSSDVPTALHP